MSVNKFMIREVDIFRYILKQLNNNSFQVKFDYADFMARGDEALMIQRLSFLGDNFDVVETFDEKTYAINKEQFVPTVIPNLNGQFTATDDYKEVLYQTNIDFLIYSGDDSYLMLVQSAIEEVRARLIQHNDVIEVSYMNLEDLTSKERVKEQVKLITMTGSIAFGQPQVINGNMYTIFSMPIDIYATNFGEFANQHQFSLGHSQILENGWALTNSLDWQANGIENGHLDINQIEYEEPVVELFPRGEEGDVLRVKNRKLEYRWVKDDNVVAVNECQFNPPTNVIAKPNEVGNTCYTVPKELIWKKGNRIGWENADVNNRDAGRTFPKDEVNNIGFYFKIPVSYAYQYDYPNQWKELFVDGYNPLGLRSVQDYINRFGMVEKGFTQVSSLTELKELLTETEPFKPVGVVVKAHYRDDYGDSHFHWFWVDPYQDEGGYIHDGWDYYYLDRKDNETYKVIEQEKDYYTFYRWAKKKTKMHKFKPLTWSFVTNLDIETTQLSNHFEYGNPLLASEIKAIPKSKSFGVSFTFAIDLRDELLRELYKDAIKQKLGVNLYKLRIETTQYNPATQSYEVQHDLTTERYYELVDIQTDGEFSKGSRMIYTMTFFPTMRKGE